MRNFHVSNTQERIEQDLAFGRTDEWIILHRKVKPDVIAGVRAYLEDVHAEKDTAGPQPDPVTEAMLREEQARIYSHRVPEWPPRRERPMWETTREHSQLRRATRELRGKETA